MVAGTILARMVLNGEESFISGVSDAADEMDDSSRSASRLSKAMDNLGDQATGAIPGVGRLASAIDRVGDQAGGTIGQVRRAGGAFRRLADGTRGVGGNISGATSSARTLVAVLGTLTAVVIPLGAAIGTLAAGFAAVAGAFGLIIGSGLLAFGKKRAKQNKKQLKQVNKKIRALEKAKSETGSLTKAQRKQLKTLEKQQKKLKDATTATGALGKVFADLKKELVPVIVDFGKKFIPLIRDAIKAIPKLVKEIFRIFGPMTEFKNALRTLGNIAMKIIPQLVKLFLNLAKWALPLFTGLAKTIMNNLVPALQSFFDYGKRATKNIGRMLPSLKSLQRMVRNVAGFVTDLWKSFSKAANRGINLDKNIGQLIKALKGLWKGLQPVFKAIGNLVIELAKTVGYIQQFGIDSNTLAIKLLTKLTPALEGIVKTITSVVRAINRIIRKVRDFTGEVIKASSKSRKAWSKIDKLLKMSKRTFNQIVKVIQRSLRFIYKSIIRPLTKRISKLWKIHGKEIQQSVNQLLSFLIWGFKKIKRVVGVVWNAFGDEIMSVVKFFTDVIVATITTFIDTLLTGFDVFTDLLSGNWKEAWKKIKGLVSRISGRIMRLVGKWGDRLVQWGKDVGDMLVKKFSQWGKDLLNGVIDTFEGIGNWIANDATTMLVNGAISAGEAMANALIDGFNKMLPDSVPIPEVTIGVGVPGPDYTFGGGSLDLPELAEGGIVTGPTIALIGESGPEKVQPLGSADERTWSNGGSADDIARAIRRELRSLSFMLRVQTDDEALSDWIENQAGEVAVSEVQSSFDQMLRRGRGDL